MTARKISLLKRSDIAVVGLGVILIALLVFNGNKHNQNIARSQAMNVFQQLGAQAQQNMELAKQGKVRVGMITDQCEMAWGKPERIDRVTTARHEAQYWFYANATLYFEDETLKSISQTTR